MKKAVIYVRVSTKGQKEEGFSIPSQKKYLKKYAKNNNLKIVKVFEEAASAKTTDRREFGKLVEFCEKNSGIAVLVEKTDRLYRNLFDKVKLDCQALDIEIHLVKENQILSRNSNSKDSFMNNIHTSVAILYSENLSEEAKKGLDEKASQGTYPAPAPNGYKNENKKIVLDSEKSLLIKQLFALASKNAYSLSDLSKIMYEKGLRGNRAGKISKSGIQRILQNEFYIGNFFWKDKLYKGDHKPIIKKALFDKIQEILKKRGITSQKKNQTFAYSGIFKCGGCGCAIVGEKKTKPSGKSYVYYHCTNGKGDCKDVKYLKEEILENEIYEAIGKIKITREFIEWTKEAINSVSKEEKEYRENQVRALTNRYNVLESNISKAYEDKLSNKIDESFWSEQTNKWKKEQEEIQNSLKGLNRANTSFMEYGIKLLKCMYVIPKFFLELSPQEKQTFVNTLLSNSIITGLSVEYHYRKPFDMMLKIDSSHKWRGVWDDYRTLVEQDIEGIKAILASFDRIPAYKRARLYETF